MKLATLRDGSRDGRLVVVSGDLTRAVAAASNRTIACRTHWTSGPTALRCCGRSQKPSKPAVPPARSISTRRRRWPLCRAHITGPTARPMSTTWSWCARRVVSRCRRSFWTDPLVYQGGSDDLLGPQDDVPVASEEFGIDLEAEIAVITDDVPMGTSPAEARAHISLLTLVNDWSLRNLIPGELLKGFGFYQSKPATAFSPLAVTPDELGAAWDGSRVHRPLESHVNGVLLRAAGRRDRHDVRFSRADRARDAAPGGSARDPFSGRARCRIYDRSRGSSCLAERRMLEQIDTGHAVTPFLRFGDRVRIEMFDAAGRSIFGAIDQCVVAASRR